MTEDASVICSRLQGGTLLAGEDIFLFSTDTRPALGQSQVVFLRVKRQGREVDHIFPSSAEVKKCVELYLHSPIRLHNMVLVAVAICCS
jgi:hypothetical protein